MGGAVHPSAFNITRPIARKLPSTLTPFLLGALGQITLPSKENTVKILTWSAAGRLFGFVAGFIGFYLVALTFFPPDNEIDSMALVIPFFLSACAVALIGGWFGGNLFGQFGRAWRRRQQNDKRRYKPTNKGPQRRQ